MKVIIAGSREIEDYKLVVEAVKASGFDITEVVSGAASGADKLGEKYAKENKIPVKKFPADWKNIHIEGAKIKEGAYGKYNALAGFWRNQEMADYADALIALQIKDTSGTQDMIKRAKEKNIPIFIYPKQETSEKEVYSF